MKLTVHFLLVLKEPAFVVHLEVPVLVVSNPLRTLLFMIVSPQPESNSILSLLKCLLFLLPFLECRYPNEIEDKFCVFCFFLEAVAAKFSTQYIFLLKSFKLFVVELSPTGACQAEKSGSSTALRQLF